MQVMVDQDIHPWIRARCGHKVTDLVKNQYNLSDVLNDYLRQFIATQDPTVIALVFKERKERLLEELRNLEGEASKTLGTTLEDFLAHAQALEVAKIQTVRSKAEGRRDQMLRDIQLAYESRRKQQGLGNVQGRALESWLSSVFRKELRFLEMSVHEVALWLEGEGPPRRQEELR